jgi:SlyX protein
MEDLQDIMKRLTELEIKASFADDLVDQLNEVVHRQQLQIARLGQQLAQLRQQIDNAPDGGTAFRSLHDELPPHY